MSSSRKIASIVKYTVEKNIRNKWFIILNALLLVVTIVGLNFSSIEQIMKDNNISFNKDKVSLEVIDVNDLVYSTLVEKFNVDELQEKIEISKKEKVEYDEKTIDKNKLILEVTPSNEIMINAKIISKEGMDAKYIDLIEQTINEKKNELYANEYNLTKENVENLTKDVEIERIMVGVDSKNSDLKSILQAFLNYAILLILMIVLSKIANDISQEKMSKSIEYVLTTISAKAYLIAKVISINLTLIAQLVFSIAYFLIASSIKSLLNLLIFNPQINTDMSNLSTSNLLSNIDVSIVFYMIIIFVFAILTILIISVIQAALSSRTTNITEASNATILLVVLNVIIYVASTMLVSPLKETSIWLYIVSCIPIVSMYFIPSMILIGQAKMIQILISLLLLIISVPFIFKYSANFFKEGILGNSTKKKSKKIKEKSVRQIQEEYVNKRDFSKYGFVIGIAVILFIVLQLVLSVIITPVISVLKVGNVDIITNILVFIISLIVPTLFVMSYIPKSDKQKEKLDIKLSIKSILVAVPIVAIIQILLSLLLEKLGLNYDIIDKINLYDSSSIISKILFFIQIAILPAIFEELFIRKAVLNYSKKYGNIFAIIASALLFSLIHLNISQSIFAFIMGVILAIIAIRTDSIIPTSIIHFLNNGYAALITIFENNALVVNVINIIMILISVIGVVIAIIEIIKARGKLFKFNIKNLNPSKSYLYIMLDYSFIVSIILIIVMLVMTQNILSIL